MSSTSAPPAAVTTPTSTTTPQPTQEFLEFEQAARAELKKSKAAQCSQMKMAFRLLVMVLDKMYGTSDIAKLVKQSCDIEEATTFSKTACECVVELGWSRATVYPIASVLKKILSQTAASPRFVSSLKIRAPRPPHCRILGRKYGSLPLDDSVRSMLDGWIKCLREKTKNRSELSLRNVVSFYLKQCLPHMKVSLDDWPLDAAKTIEDRFRDDTTLMMDICGTGAPRHRKFQWLVTFLTNVVPCSVVLDGTILGPKPGRNHVLEPDNDGEDVHRISTEDLQKIFDQAKKHLPDELMYMTLITTGMRVGGYTHIQTKHIADVRAGLYRIKETGRTLEKGQKWFSFMINQRVDGLLLRWLNEMRPADPSPYLFPSVSVGGAPITTETVRSHFTALCNAAGLDGKEFHPHALRHSYAHILLESGNDSQTVSRLLGHSSVATTEQFYLKESAAQVAARANIPWMTSPKKRNQPVPAFLVPASVATNDKKRRRKRRETLAKLDMFDHVKP
jgi:integrase